MTQSLFVSQQKLEVWIEQGEVTFQGDVLTLLAQKLSYRLEPALRIVKTVDGQDAKGLVGRTATVSELQAQGAEHFGNSLILGDTAYECEEGFLGIIEAPAKPESVAPSTTGVDTQQDAQILAEFWLKHM